MAYKSQMTRITMLMAIVVLGVLCRAASAGTFQRYVMYYTGGGYSIALGDFNRDGAMDFATDGGGNTVAVLLGNGDGTFQPHVDYDIGTFIIGGVAPGDFNGDGKLDLVVGTTTSVSVLLGNGDGTFQPHIDSPRVTPTLALAVGDFNADGKADVITANGPTVSILLGNGDGTFLRRNFPATDEWSIAVGDVNGDGSLDAVAGDLTYGTVDVFLGSGDGTLQPYTSYTAGGEPRSMAVGDFNRDGRPDLAVANNSSPALSVLLGNGDGSFQAKQTYPVGEGALAVALGDFNADKKLDILVAGTVNTFSKASVFLGTGDGTFSKWAEYPLPGGSEGSPPVSAAVADFNNDRRPDLAVGIAGDKSVAVLLNTGGTYVSTESSPNPSKAGQPVTFTTIVAPTVGVGRVPTGTVTFADGRTLLGTGTLVNGQASLTTTTLGVGVHSIIAHYSGNKSFNANRAEPITQIVE